MSDKLFEALANCLDAIEAGQDIESCLARYPKLADELRPLLVTAAQASTATPTDIPADVTRRGRARLLDAAAEMREQVATPVPVFRLRWPNFRWSGRSARLVTVTLLVLAFMVTGGTGLVSASNGALPGDRLYSVKRSWEDLRLFFAFDPLHRESLETEYENERMDEIGELFALGRESDVDFYGFITAQTDTGWIVSEVIVQITPQTRIDGMLQMGALVEVEGTTDAGGVVIVDHIRVRDGFSVEQEGDDDEDEAIYLPTLPPTITSVPETGSSTQQPDADIATSVSQPTAQPKPTNTPEPSRFEFEGIVQSMDGNVWKISGQNMNVSGAEVDGKPYIGALVRVKGTVAAGVWTASKIDVRSSGEGSSSYTSSNDDHGDGSGGGGASSQSGDGGHGGDGEGSSSSESGDD